MVAWMITDVSYFYKSRWQWEDQASDNGNPRQKSTTAGWLLAGHRPLSRLGVSVFFFFSSPDCFRATGRIRSA
jgi:hypothetical protein